jgi:hypothetical protein
MRFSSVLAAACAMAILPIPTADGMGAARTAAAPPCSPKEGLVSGHEAISYCGPATATITIGRKTYSFKNGYCRKDTKNGIPLSLTLGELVAVQSPVNGGKSVFEMTVLAIGKLGAHVNADSGGKVLDSIGTVALKGSFPSSGTFTSTGFAMPHFTGSWKCNGPLYTQ